jgi:excinuclease UvrABC nuclease subunit
MRTIYVLRDANGDVIYVGCTTDLKMRLKNLRCVVPWAQAIADVRSYEVADHRAAREELEAIVALHPVHNVQGVRLPYNPPVGLTLEEVA